MKTALARSLLLIAAVGGGLAGCGDDEPAPPPAPAALTFWGDVAPIFNDKCVKCHQAGGIAPFRLDRYEDARQHGLAAAANVKAGLMPPYLMTHDDSCGKFVDDETLTEAEKTRIWDWAETGMKEGTKVALAPVPAPTLGPAREWKTPTIVPVAEGGQLAEFDEYRCFPLDSGLDAQTFITGYDVLPGNPALVHHLVAFLVDPTVKTESGKTNGELMAELDAADPARPGWTCFSGAGEGVEPEAVPAVWAPGQGPIAYPAGIGVPHRPEHKIVIQMHYNLAGHGGHGPSEVAGMSDSTTLRLRHTDEVERQAIFVTADGFLETLFRGQPAALAPGQRSVKFDWDMTAEELGMGPDLPYVDVVGVMPHMHERGVSQQMRIGRAGAMACASNVARWDFNWQKLYFYEGAPPRLERETRLEMTCEYDTSKDSAPVVPGWGTRNEMCSAILMVVPPAGM